MKRRFVLVLVVAILLVIGSLWFVERREPIATMPTADRVGADQPRAGAGGPLRVVAPPGIPAEVDAGSFTSAQARAYAALGEVMDGRLERLPNFDRETQLVVESMRRLLETQPVHRGEGRPTVSRNGATATVTGGGAPVPISENSASDRLTIGQDGTSNLTPPTTAEGERDLRFGRSDGTVVSEHGQHTIIGKAAWAAIRAQPGQGLPIRIVDRGEGGHVIAVFGDDFGTVRVNGGLVVPGRYYLIKGSIEISSMVPVGVHIRPLSAVPSYQDQPLMSPSANG